ncbi:hypothetical protein [Polyangium sp. 15x6]|uniref:hypothetical protein n=1 Tax=Polyangium sp. 15x6 TaxID=3042687 RepID=UPI00249AE37C|nr:hypothetical protein [Polyangium sp. 15x6]MDI3291577.1 hypothetical protein [Polyangium sp. 15x6]
MRLIRQAQVAAALEGNFEMVRLLQGLVEIFLLPEVEVRMAKGESGIGEAEGPTRSRRGRS